MVLSDLHRPRALPMKPGAPSVARRLVDMALVCALLTLGRLATAQLPPEKATLVVTLAPDVAASERGRAVDEAILWAELESLDLARHDPFVRHRVAANLAFIDGDETTARVDRRGWEQLYARAERLEMFRHDPLLEAYLLGLMRRHLLAARGDPTLSRLGASHARAATGLDEILYDHVFLDSLTTPDEALETAERLRSGEQITSSPLIGHRRHARGLVRSESERWGETVGEALRAAPIDDWRGPLESPFGFHYIRVLARIPSPVGEASPGDVASGDDEGELRRAVDELRGRYDVRVVVEQP